MKNVKNACDGVAMALEFIKASKYLCFDSFMSLFESVLIIWFKPLGPSFHKLYHQYHLIYL